LGNVVGGNTILKDEAVLGSDSASVIGFHHDIHGSSGFGIYGNRLATSSLLMAHCLTWLFAAVPAD
ncbi:hypothetical protein AAIH16_38120, partial [Pseudomonas aeruginosa]